MTLAPIVLFAYNRPKHLLKTLKLLKANYLASESNLYIFCDGYKSQSDYEEVLEVRDIATRAQGFRSVKVIENQHNCGLASSVISGVNDVIGRYGSVIVLEDDLILSPYFLTYMNDCLRRYKDLKKVFSIAGWSPPTLLKAESEFSVTFLPRNCSWGWATWEDRWGQVDWNVSDYESFKNSRVRQKEFNAGGDDLSKMLHAQMRGEINSWSIRFCYSQYQLDMLTVFPLHSYVENIGCDGSGVHCNVEVAQQAVVARKKDLRLPDAAVVEEDILALFSNYYRPAPFAVRVINKLSRTIVGKNIINYEVNKS